MQRRGYCVEYAYKLLSVQVLFTITSDKLQRGLIKILGQIYFLIQIFFFFLDLAYLSLFFEFTITRAKLVFEPNFSGDSTC